MFELKEGRKILESRDVPEIGSWYPDDTGYFFMEYGRRGHAERVDFEKGTLSKIRVTQDDLRKAEKVKYAFDPHKKQDCASDVQ